MNTILLIILLLIAVPVIAILEYRSDKKKFEKELEEDRKWLAEEMKKPKSRVYFVTLDRKGLFSKHSDPQLVMGYSSNTRFTSERVASIKLEHFYEQGFFIDENMITYPTCYIKKAEVNEEAEHGVG